MKNKTLLIIIILLIPVLVISFINNKKTNSFFNEKKEKPKDEIKKIVKLKDKEKIINLDLEDYIVGVVSCEMPALFHKEALKAQAVASRTYALHKMKENNIYDLENSTTHQCYYDIEKRKKIWKTNFEIFNTKIKNAVNATQNQHMEYNNQIIDALYFSSSNGYTEDSINVFSEIEVPYLKSVDSSWETSNKKNTFTIKLTKIEFLKKLKLKDNELKTIKILERNRTNHVNKVLVNNKTFKGTDFRYLLNLRSTDFNIVLNDLVEITTKGYGHGVGMSQHGANGLAKINKTYKEILKHYYKNITIKNV